MTECHCVCSDVHVQPTTLRECIISMQRKAGICIPQNAEEWLHDIPHMSIDVRRSHIVTDVFREMKKQRFDHNKLLTVYAHAY